MDTSGLLNGSVNINVQPVQVDNMTLVKIAVVGFILIVTWGFVRFGTK